MLSEPRSGRLASWGNALLAGFVSPDDAVLAIVGEDAVHRVEGLPGEAGPVGLTLALGRLRALGVAGLRVALPAPGHPLGLSGPPDFNARALDAEEAVVCHGAALGLVPEVYEAGPVGDVHVEVVWHCLPVREAPPADVPSSARPSGSWRRRCARRRRCCRGWTWPGRGRSRRRRWTRTGHGPSGGARCWRPGIRRVRCGCWSSPSGWVCWSPSRTRTGTAGR